MPHPDPETLCIPAPAKINLFLHVVGRREDGYHLLQSAFELIDWADRITLSRRPDGEITRTGDLLCAVDDDLAVRAARALQTTPAWQAQGGPGSQIHVKKSVPSGAGLGGGSSDAASTLMGLNRLWGLGLDRRELARLGLSLGADVPFFLFGQAAFAQGVGEALEAYATTPRWVVLAVPACAVPTGPIFQAPELTRNSKPLKIAGFAQAARNPVWEFGRNDLEPVTRSRFPLVDQVAQQLCQAADREGIAPVAVRMSGSGSAVFCTAPDQPTGQRILDQMNAFQRSAPDTIAHLRLCQTLITHPERIF